MMTVRGLDLRNVQVDELGNALLSALARHECALGRLKQQLPRPSNAILSELQAAEEALRQIQTRCDLR